MKKQLHKLRRFFARTGGKKLNAATARDAASASYDEEDNSSRLSGAFVVVLVLHVLALIGVFWFSRFQNRDAGASAGGKTASSAMTTSGGERGPAAQPSTPKVAAQTPTPAAPAAAPRESDRPVAPLPTPSSSRPGRVYLVQNGDNLTTIAVAHSVKPADLRAANELKSDELRPGQELIIPDPKFVKTVASTKPPVKNPEVKPATTDKAPIGFYVVKKGDTLVGIAREHNVSYEELSKLNKISDPKKIQLNQKLKLPKKN